MLTADIEQRRRFFKDIVEGDTIIWRDREMVVTDKTSNSIQFTPEDDEADDAEKTYRLFNAQIDGGEVILRPLFTCETNTPEVQDSIDAVFRSDMGIRDIQVDFEHGQWFVTQLSTGAQWSVNDAVVNGEETFDFEQISEGEEC